MGTEADPQHSEDPNREEHMSLNRFGYDLLEGGGMTIAEELYSTAEVAELAGVTYRQLDYWLRTGTIGFCEGDEQPGSGRPRRWHPAEVDVVLECVRRWREADAVVTAFRSGAMWKEVIDGRCG
jgi:MerR HTH family regulatory protein